MCSVRSLFFKYARRYVIAGNYPQHLPFSDANYIIITHPKETIHIICNPLDFYTMLCAWNNNNFGHVVGLPDGWGLGLIVGGDCRILHRLRLGSILHHIQLRVCYKPSLTHPINWLVALKSSHSSRHYSILWTLWNLYISLKPQYLDKTDNYTDDYKNLI